MPRRVLAEAQHSAGALLAGGDDTAAEAAAAAAAALAADPVAAARAAAETSAKAARRYCADLFGTVGYEVVERPRDDPSARVRPSTRRDLWVMPPSLRLLACLLAPR